ncbi:MAG: tRNA-dihydrouridine synthase family protein [Candidatus Omnitrophota bacterium]
MSQILYMAPIQGITNSTYRNAHSRIFTGYDYCITAFIRSCNIDSPQSRVLRDLFPARNKAGFKIIPQILSNSPEDFISMAKAIAELGYESVNWNLGCPNKKVRNKKRGSGLLPYTWQIIEFLDKVIPALPIKISLKVRLGKKDSQELFELLPLLKDFPLQEIIIHPRTGEQLYSGEVDLSAFAQSLSLTKHPVVYNGDIDSLETFKKLSQRFPNINRWMIGRGGITNPFLAEQIKGLDSGTKKERLGRFISFHNELFALYQQELSGPRHITDKMKEIWEYWVKAFEGGNKLFRAITKVKKVEQYSVLVEKFFKDQPKLII